MFPDKLPPEVIEKIEEIVRLIEEGSLAIFCGAGISFNPPSNLPTGDLLTSEILGALRGGHLIREEVRVKIKEMQFEAFVEVIERNVAANKNSSLLNAFVELFSRGDPNMTHYLIAHLIAQEYLNEVMTTNFDTKIEDAVQALKTEDYIHKQRELKVLYKEDQVSESARAP